MYVKLGVPLSMTWEVYGDSRAGAGGEGGCWVHHQRWLGLWSACLRCGLVAPRVLGGSCLGGGTGSPLQPASAAACFLAPPLALTCPAVLLCCGCCV